MMQYNIRISLNIDDYKYIFPRTCKYMYVVQVGKDQEKAQSEKDSQSKNRGGKNQNNNQVLIP